MKNLTALCLSILICAGCATGSHVVTGSTHAPISPDSVKILSEIPPGAERVGVVSCSSIFYRQSGMDAVVKKAKTEAAELGANAIVIGSQDSNMVTGSAITCTALFIP